MVVGKDKQRQKDFIHQKKKDRRIQYLGGEHKCQNLRRLSESPTFFRRGSPSSSSSTVSLLGTHSDWIRLVAVCVFFLQIRFLVFLLGFVFHRICFTVRKLMWEDMHKMFLFLLLCFQLLFGFVLILMLKPWEVT